MLVHGARRHLPLLAGALPAAVLLAAGCGDMGASSRAGGAAASASQAIGPASRSASVSAWKGAPAGVAAAYATMEEEIREEGGETTSGDWRVGYIVEEAEPWHEPGGERLTWRPAAPGETHHIEILPIEARTGRLVPGVPVRLEVLDDTGRVVADRSLDFYYGEFFHYATNVSVPRSGRYTLRATLQPPRFLRHGEEDEQPPLAEGATVAFPDVRLEVPQ